MSDSDFWPRGYVAKGYRFNTGVGTATVLRVGGTGWVDILHVTVAGDDRYRLPEGVPWAWRRFDPPLKPSDLKERP